MQSHLTGIIPNVFTKESLFFIFTIRAEGEPHPRKGCADLDALRTFAEHPVRIQAQWSFKTKNTSMSESLYVRGGGVVQYIFQPNRHAKAVISGISDTLHLCDNVIGSE